MQNRIIKLLFSFLFIALLSGCASTIPFYGEDGEGVENKGLKVTLKNSENITIDANQYIGEVKIKDLLKFSGYSCYKEDLEDSIDWGYIDYDNGGNGGYYGDFIEDIASFAMKNNSFSYAGHLESAFPLYDSQLGNISYLQTLSLPVEAFGDKSFAEVASQGEVIFNFDDFYINDLDPVYSDTKLSDFVKLNIGFYFYEDSNFTKSQYKSDIELLNDLTEVPINLQEKYLLYELGKMSIDYQNAEIIMDYGFDQEECYDVLELRLALKNSESYSSHVVESFPYYLDLSNFFSNSGTIVGDIGLIPGSFDEDNLYEGIFFMIINYEYHVNYYDEGGNTFSGVNIGEGSYDNPTILSYGTNNISDSALTLKDATKNYGESDSDFLGWFDNENCDGTPVTKINKLGGNYYAKWRDPNKPYSIKYINDGTNEVLKYETDLPLGYMASWNGDNPTKKSDRYYDYTFDKWDVEFSATSGSTYDITYTALYKATPRKYNVNFIPFQRNCPNYLDGIGMPKLVEGYSLFSEYECGKDTELPLMEWDGYNFLGWYEEYYDSYECLDYVKTPKINSNHTWDLLLYGGWEQKTYSYSLKDKKGNNLYISTYTIETYQSLPKNSNNLSSLSLENYTFIGWTGDGIATPKTDVSLRGRYGDKVFAANYSANITQNKNTEYIKYVDAAVAINFAPDASELNKVYIDDIPLNSNNYVIDETNKTISFKQSYLNTLSIKKHKIVLEFDYGNAECSITVKEPTYYTVDILNNVIVNANGSGTITLNCSQLIDGFKLKVKVQSDNDYKLVSEHNNTSYITYSLSKTIDQNGVIYTFDDEGSVDITINLVDKNHAKVAGGYFDSLSFEVELVYPE